MRSPRTLLALVASIVLLSPLAAAQIPAPSPSLDSDHDGLSDAMEQALLRQFAPAFMVARVDCAGLPSEFHPDLPDPTVAAVNGTIYGQVTPTKTRSAQTRTAEIHFYHLWSRDCGTRPHPLDTEHVSVLVSASSDDLRSATWKALYWYAAAHEDTVCDVSQIARAATLHAEEHGATVWISPGKHASYLNETLCQRGCGADRCDRMTPLPTASLINLGEPGLPMNGAVFIGSTKWPLSDKMTRSNFPNESLARLEALPPTDIAWFNPGHHPAQGIISVSSTTEQALANSSENTSTAISIASDSTGTALGKSYRNTTHALGTSARRVRKALRIPSGLNAPLHPAPPVQTSPGCAPSH